MSDINRQYPTVTVDLVKLKHNIDQIVGRCAAYGIQTAGVVKGFNAIPETLPLYQASGCTAIASSRLEHFELARRLGLPGPYLAIRIPMRSQLPDLVRLTDMSLNSERTVIQAIDQEAARQGKNHGVILMADLGDLREGFWDKTELIETAVLIEREWTNLKLLGVGTNLGCYGSINATPQKMNELVAIAQAVEAAIGRPLEIVSGGGTTSLPLVLNGTMPAGINHLRIGEGIALGRDLQDLWGLDMSFLHRDVFTLQAEIVEIKDKPSYPQGEIFVDAFGNRVDYIDRGIRRRAVLAVGKIDFAIDQQLDPRRPGIGIIGSSSDHLIVDISENPDGLAVGDILEFDLRYSTTAYLTSSPYVRIVCRS